MSRRKRTITPPPAPPEMGETVAEIEALGLTIHAWRDEARNGWWIPRIAANADGYIIWNDSGTRSYPFPHYEVSHKRMFGGAYRELHGAVSWMTRAVDIKTGRASNFLGA